MEEVWAPVVLYKRSRYKLKDIFVRQNLIPDLIRTNSGSRVSISQGDRTISVLWDELESI